MTSTEHSARSLVKLSAFSSSSLFLVLALWLMLSWTLGQCLSGPQVLYLYSRWPNVHSSTAQIFIGLPWCTRVYAEYQWYRVKKTKQYLSCETCSRVVKALWIGVDSPWEGQEGADGSQALSSYVSREVFLKLSQSFVVTDLSVILWALLGLIKNEVETCLLLWRLQSLRSLWFPWSTRSSFLQQRNWDGTWIPFLPSSKYCFRNLSATEIASNEFLWFFSIFSFAFRLTCLELCSFSNCLLF